MAAHEAGVQSGRRGEMVGRRYFPSAARSPVRSAAEDRFYFSAGAAGAPKARSAAGTSTLISGV